MDVVFFTLFRTDNPYSSISLSMAKELAKTQRVFYVNHPYSLKDLVRGWLSGDQALRARLPLLLRGKVGYERLETIPDNFIAVQPPPTLPINWLPKGWIYNFFQRLNNGIVLRAIRQTLRDHQVGKFIYVNCYDPFYAGWLPSEMGAELCFYHCIDDITQNPYTARHGGDLEQEAVRHADVTLVTSTNLKKLKQDTPGLAASKAAGRIVNFFNAADTSVFQKAWTEKFPRPTELEGREGKVIGFIGNLDELRIDYALLTDVAMTHPDKTLLLVGPVNSPEPKANGLDKLPNVVFTGSRSLDQLPAYLQHMDCVLIPFLCNTLTRSIYPLKINEYLAAGKPVVSTSFSDDIRSFANCIYITEGHEEFTGTIERAIYENNAEREEVRVRTANANTWEARIRQLWKIVESCTRKPANTTTQHSTIES